MFQFAFFFFFENGLAGVRTYYGEPGKRGWRLGPQWMVTRENGKKVDRFEILI